MDSTMQLSNDDRGWIMTGLSGIACIFGASFICVDIIVRQFPGMRHFRIQDSDVFLSISLSLSFGVMLFSALYSMLPSAKKSLESGGFSPKVSAWILIACFIGGVVGIQIISRVMHHFVPHNVVDCEHTHPPQEGQKESDPLHQHAQGHSHSHDPKQNDHHHDFPSPGVARPSRSTKVTSHSGHTPRLQMQQRTTSHQSSYFQDTRSGPSAQTLESQTNQHIESRDSLDRRPTLQAQITDTISKLASGKDPSCDCDGPCYGYSDLCQSSCFKTVNARGGLKAPKPIAGVNRPSAVKNATATESTPLLHDIVEEPLTRPHTRAVVEHTEADPFESDDLERGPSDHSSATYVNEQDFPQNLRKTNSHHSHHSSGSHNEASPGDHHHHHVPTNAFLSIGLQTSIAIALHKLPEGFITYATNHANPTLGVSVFLALFIHNITEGFAMALPLYLAINNRFKAMVISFVLGGLSQPLGAAVAALWFKLAGKSGWAPNEAGYGAMFAVTAGIMASVALQLFSESLDLTHSKHLCMIGAFSGMFILGVSSALTA